MSEDRFMVRSESWSEVVIKVVIKVVVIYLNNNFFLIVVLYESLHFILNNGHLEFIDIGPLFPNALIRILHSNQCRQLSSMLRVATRTMKDV